jgi:hypothetical protein
MKLGIFKDNKYKLEKKYNYFIQKICNLDKLYNFQNSIVLALNRI